MIFRSAFFFGEFGGVGGGQTRPFGNIIQDQVLVFVEIEFMIAIGFEPNLKLALLG